MSLADQSQQWYPTSVQVTVHEARNLRIKGKNGTNDAYAIFQMAKDKFSTSVAERCVVPMWKEEASFDLPLFHPNNAERCTLHIIIMHRAHVGLDKFLGQAIINLLDLHDNKSREKTDWFTLVDKTGKEDKARGEVLLDIQFMRNNMSASMFDLSMQDKPRSRISKLKDKVRGKRKDGLSDSASAIVPSSQVLTDSEGEADAQSLNQSAGVKKKSKLKTLFAPKTNLQRNVSQSMSTLGTLPEKNSSLTGSRSSGLNVDSPDVKKKFKFLGHKRTGSNDSKVSQGPFSLLGRSKQSNNDPNSLCINGNHVYAEEAEPQSGSTLSLNSSGQGSAEDVRRPDADGPTLEQQRHQEEEQKRRAEESHTAEAKRLEEEKRRAEAQRLREDEERKHQEEQERRRRTAEDEAKRKKQREEEEDRRRQEEEHRRLEATENQRMEEERQSKQEEAQKAEELKRQEEASMSERLTSLFGMIRKKEEKKEEVHHPSDDKEAVPKPAPRSASKHLESQSSHHATIPFEETPLSLEGQNPFDEEPAGHPKPSHSQQIQSAMVILNRTAKVSAVKPRLADFVSPEPSDIQSHIEQYPSSPTTPESTLSSVPSESLVMFSSLHSSLAPPKTKTSSSDSPSDDIANLSFVVSSPTMSETKQRAPLPPNHVTYRAHAEVSALQEQPSRSVSGSKIEPIREFENPGYYDAGGLLRGKRPPLPLPDYESLFPQKRHGVQGHTRWDHLIAEVSQKQREHPEEFLGKEMSVDDPEVHVPNPKSSLSPESTTVLHHKAYPQETKPSSSKKVAAPLPPKPVVSTPPRTLSDLRQKQSLVNSQITQSVESPISVPLVSGSNDTETSSRKVQSIMPDSGKVQSMMPNNSVRKVLRPPTMADDQISMQSTEGSRQPNNIGDKKIESSTLLNQKAYPQDTKRSSSKKVAAPLPPKPVVSTPPRTLSDLRQKQSLVNSQITQSVESPISVPLVSGYNDTETSSIKVQSIMPDSGEVQFMMQDSREVQSMMPNSSVRKALRPPTMADDQISMQSTEGSRQPNHIGDSKLEQAMPDTIAKEMPTAKPRQKAGSNESIKQADSDKNLNVSVNTLKSNNPNVSNTAMCNMDIDEANENIFKSDPFPSGDLLSRDPWAQLENNHSVDYLFTGRVQTEQRLADQGMADDNLAKYFTTNKPTDPFSAFDDSDSGKHTGHKKQVSQNSPVFKSRHSHRRNQTPQSLSNVVIKDDKAHQEATPKQDFKITAVQKTMPATAIKGDYLKLQDPFGAGPFVLPSTSPMSSLMNTSEPFHVAMEDSPYQLEGLSEGKTPLRAWVSPSEVNVLNNNGGGLASTPRRPHPVKPMSSFENQFSNSTPAVREVHDTTTAKQKATESVESGPYTQLTQEELITLVVKQQTELSKKDAKISELEEYIDNLLVRVIEEKPSILLSLNSGKPK